VASILSRGWLSNFLPTELILFWIKGTLERKGNVVVDEEKHAKHAKPGPRTERKKGGLKRKRDNENDQEKSLKCTKGRKKEGKSGGQSSTQKPAVTIRIGAIPGKLKYCWPLGIALAHDLQWNCHRGTGECDLVAGVFAFHALQVVMSAVLC
jgi:hypothetical protein